MSASTRSASFAFSKSDMPVRFGKYLLLKRRAADPIGEEFLAAWGVDEGVDQLRYVRGIYTSVAEESQFIALFSEEARALSRLASANVLRVVEVGVEGGIHFVACEHVEGVTLERLIELSIRRKTPWPWELSVHITAEILRGLDYIHRREDILGKPMGMRHGDVRPANAIISFDGEVKLQNFGSALYFIADDRTNARVQTYRGIYAPPEASAVDEATIGGDLWGVSAILSTLLGGKISQTSTEKLPVKVANYPKELDAVLAKALHHNPDQRFQEASEMRDKLLTIMHAHSKGHPPDDLAKWTQTLGNADRLEEAEIVRTMLGQDAQMSLGVTAEVGKLNPGTVLDGRYHLLRLLGEGGMGLVFEAEHIGLGRPVAVKVLHERVLDDDIAVERFRREAQITGSLGHANIIGVSDFGVTHDGHHYLVMDLLEGEPLGTRISRETIDPIELARIMIQVCDGLAAAHEAGVVHRDLKPDNIFLTDAGPRIVDFGIAKRNGLEDPELSLTRTGHICGTAEYLAPEQVNGQESDYRCDIYAAGVIIYEGLTGETPFRGRTLGETLHKVMADKVVPPRKRSGDNTIPRELEAICLKALSRNPEKRYEKAAEMASALRDFLDEESKMADDAVSTQRRRRTVTFAMGSALLVTLASITLLLVGFLGRPLPEAKTRESQGEKGSLSTNPDEIQQEKHNIAVSPTNPLPSENRTLSAPKTNPPSPAPLNSGEESVKQSDPNQPKKTRKTGADGSPKSGVHKSEAVQILKQAEKALAKMNLEMAAELFERALILDPRTPRAWYGLGRVYFEQGRYEDAAKKIEYSLKLSPGAKTWRIYLGKVYRAMGKADRAIACWRRVLEVDPTNQTARKLLESSGVTLED